MLSKYGKLFKETATGKVRCLSYDAEKNYYSFIQEMQNKGFMQCIITSDIMIRILQNFVLKNSIEITAIEFMTEDDELDEEINSILLDLKKNASYWDVLKDRLAFLSQNDCIEVKKISLKILEGMGALISIQVNGILVISESEYEILSNKVAKIVEGCIK